MDNVETLIKQIGTLKDFIDAMDSSWISVRGTEVNLAIKFDELCEELAKTKDQRGLLYLLDYFNAEFDDKYEGVLQCLENDIFDNYSNLEIVDAFYEKFDQLLHRNIERAKGFCFPFFEEDENFEYFRRMFNTVKSEKSLELLNMLNRSFSKSSFADYYEYGIEFLEILREDMKKW